MLFPTLSFAAFFALVLPVSWLLMPHRVRWRLFMVAASWFFYGAADWRFVPLLAGSTIVNHYFARRIYRAKGQARKSWTVVAVAANLVVLGWFKYIGFLSLTTQSTMRFLGIHARVPLPEVLLPIGISFFTFQALSYIIDTSRGKIQPVSLLEFAVYLSFFPHLIAGPIVRATEFLPQIKDKISPRNVDVSRAFWLISLGLFKKVVVSSYLSTYAADPLFGFPRQHGGVEALFGVYAYAIQIYMDFSGYTDIAIGLALLLGIQFPQNFNCPYAAASLQDFWRRWHMTLSRWLRDYLYIPLGGNRRGRVRTYLNVMITMLLGGLWHGAAWTFVAWGALHGVYLIAERWRSDGRRPPSEAEGAGGGHDLGKGRADAAASVDLPPRPDRREEEVVVTASTIDATSAPPPDRRTAVARRVSRTARSYLEAAPATRPPPPAVPVGAAADATALGVSDIKASSIGYPRSDRIRAAAGSDGEIDPRFPVSRVRLSPDSPPLAAAVLRAAATSGDADAQAGRPDRSRPALSPPARLWLGRLVTFHLVCLAWVFFRATSFHNAVEVLGRVGSLGGRHRPFNWKVAAIVVGSLAIQVGPRGIGARMQVVFSRSPFWLQALYVAGLLTVIDLLGPAGVAPFIYFRF